MVAQFAATQMAVASSYVSQVPTANSSSPYCSGRISQQFIRFHWLKYKPSRAFSVRASAHSADDSVVTLLDYGAGNVRSVRNTILFLGFDIKDVPLHLPWMC
ncbi:imidazole glycerol phosphate synthase hisHF, chloroplastic-like isoform X2 [Primulina huaijiensis]|uniref:imidazole glycerol phosphate synthase hisHF, chloroplastic-like isoform X2 n=1 Tax=Primulina huaijiensis TaxID=1492673 RepID=UPI003CC6F168